MDVELNLEGPDGQISAENLHGALGELLDLLSEAAEVADVGRQSWRITELSTASAHVSIDATDGGVVASVVREGLDSLRASAAIPAGWTRQMVKRVLDLGSRAGTGGTTALSLRLGGSRSAAKHLDSVITVNADRALGSATSSFGALRGKVNRWNEAGRREIGLSRESGSPVAASYPVELSHRIQSTAIGQDIEAWGTIRRNVVGQISGMTIDDFRVIEAEPAISIRSMVGVFKTAEGEDALTLADWLDERHGDAH